ncbi:flagellin, partial [Pseudoalteromonas sp. S983]
GATTTNASLDTTTSLSSVATLDISTAGGSQSAIDVIDAALKQIGNERAELGATQNRFSQTISNLANVQENASASRSRIMDTDYATETAHMTKNQILQQAGTSILSQANQIPQAAISLLGG